MGLPACFSILQAGSLFQSWSSVIRKAVEWLFQNMSIRVKLLISYLCVTLIPIIVFGMIMTSWLRENTMEKAIQEARDSSARVEERIQSLLSTVNEVSNQLCVDEELYQIATTQFESPLECIEALNDYKTFQEYENTYPEIVRSKRHSAQFGAFYQSRREGSPLSLVFSGEKEQRKSAVVVYERRKLQRFQAGADPFPL